MRPSRIASGFNRLAPVYTILTKLVFGGKLNEAQKHFLKTIKPDDRVLVLGGGSGDFLLALLQQHPQLSIDYIDISSKMIELSKKKTSHFLYVNFIVGTEQNIPNKTYSVVITNFYLDLFPDQKLSYIVRTISKHLTPAAHWLVTDFVQEKCWQRAMLWIMYRFFRSAAGIEAHTLPDWQSGLVRSGMQLGQSKKIYNGFIESAVYKKA